jgi:hypothetical protein
MFPMERSKPHNISILISNQALKESTLPLWSSHWYELQLVQKLPNLNTHTSPNFLQSCAAYTCQVEKQQIKNNINIEEEKEKKTSEIHS